MTTEQNPTFFEKAFQAAVTFVTGLFKKAETDVQNIEHSIAKFGDAVVNEYKSIQDNTQFQDLASWFVKIAETIDPALVPLISGIELAFPKIINLVNGILGEIEKPVPDQLSDGITHLETVKGINGTVYANALGGINAAIQNYVISNNATDMPLVTDAQLITAAQVVHAQQV